ncbi:MAG: tetratricopeptide repeat protein [Acidobacteria bacterium]|nr:tetratricopeptide repeat protein [Acidobacteriota bacterium]
MLAKLLKTALFPTLLLTLSATAAWAQTGSLQGSVMDGEEGVVGAKILIERTDIKGAYSVKTKKKGRWFHAGLPLGTYDVAVEVDGKVVDQVRGVRVGVNDGNPIDFDIAKVRAQAEAAKAAAAQGQVQQATEQQIKSMSAAERKAYEENLKQRQAQISKNKELNEAFNAGMTAKNAGDLDGAVAAFQKATTLDANQHVIWAQLADSQSAAADKKAGDAKTTMLNDAAASYAKAIELSPENASYHNNLGLALIKAGKTDEGQAELSKAAEMDPVNGGRYYYNLGAVLINSGNTDGAIDAFRKATEKDPNYAAAYYQLGTALVGKAETKDDGSVVPVAGTVESFQKYLEIEPNGPMAESAQMMIQTLTGPVETTFENPDANKKKKK